MDIAVAVTLIFVGLVASLDVAAFALRDLVSVALIHVIAAASSFVAAGAILAGWVN